MDENKMNPEAAYRLTIKETMFNPSTVWLNRISITYGGNGETQLIGTFADQPALRRLLDQLWNLNYMLLSVERIEYEHPK